MLYGRSWRAALVVIIAAVWLARFDGAAAQAPAALGGFETIDTDHDAKLDRAELTTAAERDFSRLDIDHDGYLTRTELEKVHNPRLLLPLPGHLESAAAFAAADTDHDKRIDEHEYVTTVVSAYLRCDRNHDGTIEVSDLQHCRM